MWQEESILIESNCGSRKSSASLSDIKTTTRKKSKQQEKNFYRKGSMEEDTPEDSCKFTAKLHQNTLKHSNEPSNWH